MHLDESKLHTYRDLATISVAGSLAAACDASGRAEPSRSQRSPVAGDDSDGLLPAPPARWKSQS